MNKSLLTIILVALLVGGVGGVLAALGTESYLARYGALLEQGSTPPRLGDERPRSVSGSYQESVVRVRERVLPSVVRWHRRLPETASIARGSYLDAGAIGSGVVLSSDGWVLTSQALFSAAQAPALVAVVGDEVYDVVEVKTDPATDLLLAKLTATNLPVVPFGDAGALHVGDQLFVADRGDHFVSAAVGEADEGIELVETSEDADVTASLLLVGNVSAGSAVVNGGGDLVGWTTEIAGEVRPLEWALPAVRQVLRGKEIERPRLGVETILLDQAVGHPAFGKGALVSTAPRRDTPAFDAGVLLDDVIVRVGGQEVSSERPIARLLLDYSPGDTVTLGILRDGAEVSVDVTLDALP